MAKRTQESADKKAAEMNSPGSGVDVDIAEIVALVDEENEKAWEDYEGERYRDAASG
jgi:hypothetical protein